MVGVDGANAAVAVDVVAGEENVAHAEAELTVGMSGREPNVERHTANLDFVAVLQLTVDLEGRHIHVDLLGLDLCEGPQLVAGFERRNGPRMSKDGGFQELFRLGHALNVIDVGVSGDQHLALAEREIHVADQLNDFLDGFIEANVDQQPIAAVKNQIDAAAENLPRLEVHFDHIRKNRLAGEHEQSRGKRRSIIGRGPKLANPRQRDCK